MNCLNTTEYANPQKAREGHPLLRNGAFLFFAFAILLEPEFFNQLGGIDTVYNVGKVLVSLIVGVVYATRFKPSKIVVWVFLYYCVLFSVTLMHHGDVKTCGLRGMQFTIICMLVEMVVKCNPKAVFSVWLRLLLLMAAVNLCTVLLFPKGLYRSELPVYITDRDAYWFLGYKNQMINFTLPMMCLAWLGYAYGSKKRAWLPLAAAFLLAAVTALAVWSGASLIITASMLAAFLLRKLLNESFFNFRTYFVINIILVVAIVGFHFQEYFSYFIQNVLKKDVTLSNRTFIWDQTLRLIQARPWLGYGKMTYLNRQMFYPLYRHAAGAVHAHNRYMEVLFSGGVLLLLCYLAILLTACKSLMKNRAAEAAKILAITLFIYLTGMITEVYSYSPMFFALMTMAYHSGCFQKAQAGVPAAQEADQTA